MPAAVGFLWNIRSSRPVDEIVIPAAIGPMNEIVRLHSHDVRRPNEDIFR